MKQIFLTIKETMRSQLCMMHYALCIAIAALTACSDDHTSDLQLGGDCMVEQIALDNYEGIIDKAFDKVLNTKGISYSTIRDEHREDAGRTLINLETDCHADRAGESLTERARGNFDAGAVMIRVTLER